MPRYINADMLDDIVLDLNANHGAGITRYEYKLIDDVLFYFPTADVVERKRGEWVSLNGWITCSECGCEPPNETNIESDFCPNCGADMRSKR